MAKNIKGRRGIENNQYRGRSLIHSLTEVIYNIKESNFNGIKNFYTGLEGFLMTKLIQVFRNSGSIFKDFGEKGKSEFEQYQEELSKFKLGFLKVLKKNIVLNILGTLPEARNWLKGRVRESRMRMMKEEGKRSAWYDFELLLEESIIS